MTQCHACREDFEDEDLISFQAVDRVFARRPASTYWNMCRRCLVHFVYEVRINHREEFISGMFDDVKREKATKAVNWFLGLWNDDLDWSKDVPRQEIVEGIIGGKIRASIEACEQGKAQVTLTTKIEIDYETL